jgi:hypothetical protein
MKHGWALAAIFLGQAGWPAAVSNDRQQLSTSGQGQLADACGFSARIVSPSG